jgi:predicted NAD/FAD-binding protein
VIGGSQAYVSRLLADYPGEIRSNCAVTQIRRLPEGVEITDIHGDTRHYDRVVIATHGDQALKLLADPSPEEQRLLSAFRYSKNLAVLHSDRSLMPRRKITWSSWNFVGRKGQGSEQDLCVTYWMNLLQGLPGPRELFLTLNPITPPAQDKVMHTQVYEHPIFDAPAIRAQREVWTLQGTRHTYFCGAHFGSGFHEDGLQAGLAAAELAADVRRPWSVEGESNRIVLAPHIEKAA